MFLNDVEISMDISIVQPKSAIHTWIYPWMFPWIYPWISISTATLINFVDLTNDVNHYTTPPTCGRQTSGWVQLPVKQ